MELGVLFSGGKDSTLAALLLEDGYDLTLVTVHFGITDDWRHARDAALACDLAFERLALDRSITVEAVDRILDAGYPRPGIQYAHEEALEALASERFDAIADGTRRDDRVPSITRAQAQSLEDRHDVDYLAPLWGLGRGAVDHLVEELLDVTVGPSDAIDRADYEAELRTLIATEHGAETVEELFPEHDQTSVNGRRDA